MRNIMFIIMLSLSFLWPATGPVQAGTDAASDTGGPSGMVLVQAGSFLMGSPRNENSPIESYPASESPRHKVSLDAFYIDKFEVTNERFAAFLNSLKGEKGFDEKRPKLVVIRNDLDTPGRRDWWPTEISFEDGCYKALPGFERYPVVSVSWYAADSYCKWIGGRLPTEAEWEKAARGGIDGSDYPWGNELPTSGVVFKQRWRSNAYPAPTSEVDSYYPNGYGLYHMAGNASEWCADWYAPDYYKNSPGKDPKGPEAGRMKVIRGGSWASLAATIRAAYRNFSTPDGLNSGVGFRCVKDAR